MAGNITTTSHLNHKPYLPAFDRRFTANAMRPTTAPAIMIAKTSGLAVTKSVAAATNAIQGAGDLFTSFHFINLSSATYAENINDQPLTIS